MSELYVQYGCGWSAPAGWVNFDSSPTLRFERLPVIGRLYTKNAQRFPENVRYGDIVRGLPVAAESCRGIYCSHVLEHLSLSDFDVALRNTRALLRPGGTFRLVVPDLATLARTYLESEDPMASARFMKDSYLGKAVRRRDLMGVAQELFGGSAHLWMWDARSMATKLEAHGFRAIRVARFGDAEDPRFREVEDEGRFVDAIALQCVR